MLSAMNTISTVASTLSSLSGAGLSNQEIQPGLAQSASPGAAPTPFSDLLTDAVGQVNQLEAQAHTAVAGLMSGSGVDVHQAMIATEKASMSFELALAVHNKAIQAYQQVIGMQF
jgi:flagellar hook-basal body complex protein FliE